MLEDRTVEAGELSGSRRVVGTGLSLVVVAIILVLHYSTALHAFGLHDVLRRLFYIPVITAAIAGGLWGGLLAAGVAAVGYVPHLVQLAQAGDRGLDHAIELVLLPLVAALVGGFADANRRARALAAERGRLAALGEVGMAIMAQVEGPLAAIEGQAEALAVHAVGTRDGSLGFTARVIRADAMRARRLLTDLRGLGRPHGRRVRKVDLSGIAFGVAREIRTAVGESRLRLVSLVEDAWIRADPAPLGFSLRSLLVGLLESVPVPGGLAVTVAQDGPDGLVLEVRAISAAGPVPDLEGDLARVFGARVSEYRFRQALCLHLLAGQGATIEFRRDLPEQAAVRLRFSRVQSPARHAVRQRPLAPSRSSGPHARAMTGRAG